MKLKNILLVLAISAVGGSVTVGTSVAGTAKGDPLIIVPLELEKPAYAIPWVRYKGWSEKDFSQYSSLAKEMPSPVGELIKIEGAITGDAKQGQKLAFDRTRGGSCLACHIMGAATPDLPGNVGPDLSTIGISGKTDEYLFNYVYDPRHFKPDSIMPPWGAHKLFTTDEIKDIVAFLKTLNAPKVFKDKLENPATRPEPKETRDHLDPFVNNAMEEVEKAGVLYSKVGPSGKSCLSCHAKPEVLFKTWAASMPKFEPRLNKVLGVEEFVTRHARATTGDEFLMQGSQNTALAIYLRYIANGSPITVDVTSPGAKEAHQRGQALMKRKIGQLNFACVDCHSPEKGANKWIRAQWLGESKGQISHFPLWRTSRSEVWDINKRFQWCGVAVWANELPPGSAEYGDIELTLSKINQGEKLRVPGIRH